MIKSKRKYIVYLILGMLMLYYIFHQRINNTETKKEIKNIEEINNYLTNKEKFSQFTEGNTFESYKSFGNDVKRYLESHLSNHKYVFITYFPEVKCPKCFEFHKGYIEKIFNKLDHLLVIDKQRKIISYNFDGNDILISEKSKLFVDNYFTFFLIGKDNKIIWADQFMENDYSQSEMFYKKVLRFISD